MYKPKTHVGKVWLDIEPKQRPGISPQDREDVLIRIDGAILLLNGTLKDLHPGVSTAPAR